MKQFDLTVLPKLTRAELEFQRLWPRFDPDLEQANVVIRETLSKVEGSVVDLTGLRLNTARVDKRENVLRFIDDTSLLVCGAFTASGASFVLSTPKSLAKKLVFSLLGAQPAHTVDQVRISDIEAGIFNFIVASVTDSIQSQWRALGISFRFASFDDTSASEQLLKSPQLIELSFALEQAEISHDIRLILEPDPDFFSTLNSYRDNDHAARGVRLAGNAPVSLRVALGEASILAKDVSALQVDNILMLDKTQARFVSGSLSGLVHCQVGENAVASIPAQIFKSDSDQYAIQLDDLPSELQS